VAGEARVMLTALFLLTLAWSVLLIPGVDPPWWLVWMVCLSLVTCLYIVFYASMMGTL
jgi:ABC-type multidrug transport system permease subunit